MAVAFTSLMAWSLALPAIGQHYDLVTSSIEDILHKQLYLAKAINQLQLQSAHPQHRDRRMFVYNMSNALSTEAGLTSATALFWRHAKRSNDHIIAADQIEDTLEPQILGQLLGGTGSSLELVTKAVRWFRQHKRERQQDRDVINIAIQLKDSFQKLHLTISDIPAGERSFYLNQETLLRRQSNRLLHLYMQMRIKRRANLAYQYGQDIISLSRNSVGAVGNSLNVEALHIRSRHLNATGSLLSLMAASGIIVLPYVSAFSAKLARSHSQRYWQEQLSQAAPVYHSMPLPTTPLQIGSLEESTDSTWQADAYRTLRHILFNSELICQTIDLNDKRQFRRDLWRNDMYGPTKFAQATMGLIVNQRRRHNPVLDNRLSASANTIYTAGQVFNITELFRQRLSDELSLERQKKLDADILSLTQENHQAIAEAEKLIEPHRPRR